MMDTNNKTGRQEVVAAYFDFDIDDFKNVAGTVLTTAIAAMELPQGARVLAGAIVMDTAFNGTTPTMTLGDDSEDTPTEDRYMAAGAVNAADTPVAVVNSDGWETPQACNLTMKLSASDATAGIGRLCVTYVVAGRTAFTQG